MKFHNRVIRFMQLELQLNFNKDSKYDYVEWLNNFSVYFDANKENIDNKIISDIYYQIGIICLLNKNFTISEKYLIESDKLSSPSLLSTICKNYCSIQSAEGTFIEYSFDGSENYSQKLMYKYLELKYKMKATNSYDYALLKDYIIKIISEQGSYGRYSLVMNLCMFEAKFIDRYFGNHNLYRRIVKN